MPSYYRGIDDDSHLWRIDVNGPSKKQRIQSDDTDDSPINFFEECSSTGSSSNNSLFTKDDNHQPVTCAEDGMDTEDVTLGCVDSDSNVEDILSNYIQNINQVYPDEEEQIIVLKKGLDKLLFLVGGSQTNNIVKQRNRNSMLNLGGHWQMTDILKKYAGNRRQQGRHGNNYCNKQNKGEHDFVFDRETRIVAIVIQACKILSELLLTDPNAVAAGAHASSTSSSGRIKYQIYVAKGMDVILSAMNRFPSNLDIQITGCKFLSNLISRPSTSSSSSSFCDDNAPDESCMVDDLYRSTNRLDLIIRLIGGYNFIDSTSNDIGSSVSPSEPTKISGNQVWYLFFSGMDVIKKVLQQSDPNLNRRSELITAVRGIKERSINFDISSYNYCGDRINDTMMADDEDNTEDYDGDHVEGFHSSWGFGSTNMHQGFGKHIYDHFMSILLEEENKESMEI